MYFSFLGQLFQCLLTSLLLFPINVLRDDCVEKSWSKFHHFCCRQDGAQHCTILKMSCVLQILGTHCVNTFFVDAIMSRQNFDEWCFNCAWSSNVAYNVVFLLIPLSVQSCTAVYYQILAKECDGSLK